MMTGQEKTLQWQYASFTDLSNDQLFAILQERQRVFVLEQQCLYADIDDIDRKAMHLTAWFDQSAESPRVAAYLRVIAPCLAGADVSLGRVLVSASARGSGLGIALMHRGLDLVAQDFPDAAVKISAQHYLEKFYLALGFVRLSDVYDEDGIPHIDMRLNSQQPPPVTGDGTKEETG